MHVVRTEMAEPNLKDKEERKEQKKTKYQRHSEKKNRKSNSLKNLYVCISPSTFSLAEGGRETGRLLLIFFSPWFLSSFFYNIFPERMHRVKEKTKITLGQF